MATDLSKSLVVGISATALFDLSEADKVFREKLESSPKSAVEEYRKYMLANENNPLGDGTGMPLVQALLHLNEFRKKEDPPIVEVVVMSRNSPETGFRVLNEIRRRKLSISRMAFTAGESNVDYLESFSVDLFLTTSEQDAQKVTDSNVCAAAVVKAPPQSSQQMLEKQVRFAFDADAVIFSEDSEIINQKHGLDEFYRNEDANQEVPLPEGPYANLLVKLSNLKERLSGYKEFSPLKLAIITARNSPAEMRVVKTLRKWDVYVDMAFFLGGLEKRKFLKPFNPHIFFDDQDAHLDAASTDIPCAKVLYPSSSPLIKIFEEKKKNKKKQATQNSSKNTN
jgi:5'-nucleotidase